MELLEMAVDSDGWDTKAERIIRAFGSLQPVRFIGKNYPTLSPINRSMWEVFLETGDAVRVTYGKINRDLGTKNDVSHTTVSLRPDGSLLRVLHNQGTPTLLLKGLHNLGLLSEEIKTALNHFPSSHELIEWSLEHESRVGLPLHHRPQYLKGQFKRAYGGYKSGSS